MFRSPWYKVWIVLYCPKNNYQPLSEERELSLVAQRPKQAGTSFSDTKLWNWTVKEKEIDMSRWDQNKRNLEFQILPEKQVSHF